tara:strand:- start:9780 stop:10757 length:978 start_codon:yes stop_codon:yes gene_type:complete
MSCDPTLNNKPDASAIGALGYVLAKNGATPYDWSSGTIERWPILFEDMREVRRLVGHRNVITGSRQRRSKLARQGASMFVGRISMPISARLLQDIIPKLIGVDDTADDTFNPGTLQEFGVLINRHYGTFEYQGCKVAQWAIRGRSIQFNERNAEPDLMTLTMQIYAKDRTFNEATAPSPLPAWGTTDDYCNYFFDQTTTATLQGVASRRLEEWVLTGNNYLDVLYGLSRKPTSICSLDTQINFQARARWNKTQSSMFNTDLAASNSAVLALSQGNVSTTFNFGDLKIVNGDPSIQGKGRVRWNLEAEVLSTNSSNDIQIVNDATV